MTHSLNGDEWQIVYDFEGKRLFIRSTSQGDEFSVNDFLALRGDTRAGFVLQDLIIDMFPPEADGDPLS